MPKDGKKFQDGYEWGKSVVESNRRQGRTPNVTKDQLEKAKRFGRFNEGAMKAEYDAMLSDSEAQRKRLIDRYSQGYKNGGPVKKPAAKPMAKTAAKPVVKPAVKRLVLKKKGK